MKSYDSKFFGLLGIFGAAFLISFASSLDIDKDNSTGVSLFSQDNADFGEDEDFAFADSSEQLPCSDLRGYAFDNSTTKKCWSVGERGPCPPQMKFMKNPLHEGYGECDCLQMKNCIGRPRSYWPPTDRCYFIYSQGPCPPGQWLVFNSERKPECRPNLCGKQVKPSQKSLDFLFPFNGTCYKTGTTAFCEDQAETVYISSSDLKPRCYTTKPVCRFLIFTAKTLSCRPGSKLDVTGRCNHMREMDEE
ncbi:uncharacterized protein LOC110863204 [Folsomia candida]|uniref:DUF4789 domain-containing protein n=1 Tax=Folsomia candida TaxID=158441 RepID=A0A226F682_FOLCA|nr:uncharacterized protein LOC110863204 [Folsomia candida]OXA64958.1 hypothetical protein Fcan01_02632 [Folsomia candida]